MGRFHRLDEGYEHEGAAIGYVPADWRAEPQAIDFESRKLAAVLPPYSLDEPLRELGTDEDRCIIKGVRVAGYLCGCGWHAKPVLLDAPLEWFPRILETTRELDDELAREWSEHVERRCAKRSR